MLAFRCYRPGKGDRLTIGLDSHVRVRLTIELVLDLLLYLS